MERPEPKKYYSSDTIAELMTSLLDPLLVADAMEVAVRVMGDVVKRLPDEMRRETLDHLWIDVVRYLYPDTPTYVEHMAAANPSEKIWAKKIKNPPSLDRPARR